MSRSHNHGPVTNCGPKEFHLMKCDEHMAEFQKAVRFRGDVKRLLDDVPPHRVAQLLMDVNFVQQLNSATFENLMKNQRLRHEICHLIQFKKPNQFDPLQRVKNDAELDFVLKLISRGQYLMYLQDQKSFDQVKGFILARLDEERARNEAFKEKDQEIRDRLDKIKKAKI